MSRELSQSELRNYRWASTAATASNIVAAIFEVEDFNQLDFSDLTGIMEISFIRKNANDRNGPPFKVTAKIANLDPFINGYYPCPDDCQNYNKSLLWKGSDDKNPITMRFSVVHVGIVKNSRKGSCVAFRFQEGGSVLGMYPASLGVLGKITQYNEELDHPFVYISN